MKIKHSKFRNTGLIYELLVKQIAADTLSKHTSPALEILKEFFTGGSMIGKELKLYEYILKNRNLSDVKAETVVSTITEISRKLNQKKLREEKYRLISLIKENYSVEEFFGIQVRDYKPLAAMYCLLEAQNTDTLVNPDFLINNKLTIIEHLTSSKMAKETVKDTLIEEYSKYEKDLRLLTYKILLEKFNNKYDTLIAELGDVYTKYKNKEQDEIMQHHTSLDNYQITKINTLKDNLSAIITNLDFDTTW